MSFVAKTLALFAALALTLWSPTPARAQAITHEEVTAANTAFQAGDFQGASNLFAAMCAKGSTAACGNRDRALFNLGLSLENCKSSSANFCAEQLNRSADAFDQVCASPAKIASTQTACFKAMNRRLVARAWAVADLTTPPTPAGCVQIDPVSYVTSFTCERNGFAMYCTIAKSAPSKGCSDSGPIGMPWETFGPGTTPDLELLQSRRGKPGGFDVYWYECYGMQPRHNDDSTKAGAVAFDLRTGWRNVKCYTRDGVPTAPLYRNSRTSGDRGPGGQ